MKLNLRMIIGTLEVLIIINILLIGAVFGLTFWQAEEDASILMENKAEINQTLAADWKNNNFGYALEVGVNENVGVKIWPTLHEKTPLKNYEILREVTFGKNDRSFLGKMEAMQYRMGFINEKVTITGELGSRIFQYPSLFLLILILEILIVLDAAFRGRKKIKRILRPISDLTRRTQRAQNLAPGAVANPGTAANPGNVTPAEIKRLRELAGTISGIDATKLDKRLPVDGTQKELKDLANAINSMLDRIDAAYTTQVRFVSDASHELRTPIAVIQGYANLLNRWGKNDPDTLEEAIEAIKSESENMQDLVEQLLFLARGDNETLQLYPEIFDCGELVEEILHETQMIDTAHSFRMKEGARGLINADRQLMKQALRILVDNSIKYTPAEGEIVVSVTAENGLVRISVQDNGIGMNPDNLPHIFDRFYRSDESRARKTGGSGLGLSIMKWIVDRHEGKIEVISRKEIGTRTTIILPQELLAVEIKDKLI